MTVVLLLELLKQIDSSYPNIYFYLYFSLELLLKMHTIKDLQLISLLRICQHHEETLGSKTDKNKWKNFTETDVAPNKVICFWI